MTIKWPRLPYLVKKEILDHLSMNQVFFLSLCSKNTKNFIIQTQKKQFEKIERIECHLHGEIMFISMRMLSSEVPVNFMHLPRDSIERYSHMGIEEVRVDELGTPIDFYRSPIISSDLHAKYTESTIGAIHKHLHELLGHRPKFRLYCDFRKACLPLIPNIHMLQVVHGANLASERIEEFLSSSTHLEYFIWHASDNENVKFEENSKVYEVDTVEVLGSNVLAAAVLEHFNGRNAVIWCQAIENNHVMKFMKTWKSGEKFRNLEFMIFFGPHLDPEIRRTIRIKKLSKKAVFRSEKKDGAYEPHFESRWYMVRRSDRCVASVLLKPGRVHVGVWNMTEDKFLEKFQ